MIKNNSFNFLSLLTFYFISILLVACNRNDKTELPGYIEGTYTYISSGYGGVLQALYVSKGQKIIMGQPLFALEALPENAELDMANARLKEATDLMNKSIANYNLQKIEIGRKQRLLQKGIISKEEFDSSSASYDQAYSDLKASEANVNALKASQQKANWITQQKIVNAPFSSLVFDTYYTKGEFVESGNPIVSLLSPSQIKVIFFVSEKLLSRMKLDQIVEIKNDSYIKPFKAKIISISNRAEYTPPVIYSKPERENLVYRIEAIPLVSQILTDVHTGQPITVKLNFIN